MVVLIIMVSGVSSMRFSLVIIYPAQYIKSTTRSVVAPAHFQRGDFATSPVVPLFVTDRSNRHVY